MKTSQIRKIAQIIMAIILSMVGTVTATGDEIKKTYEPQTIIVANPTPMNGHFFTEMWGVTTSERDVQDLIEGYKLVIWDRDLGNYKINQKVVSGFYAIDLQNGNRTYYFHLSKDMKYSDETPITAWDYAFSILLQIAPEIKEIGGTPKKLTYIRGYKEYIDEKKNETEEPDPYIGLAGVRVLNDYILKIEVEKEYIPYFYELERFIYSPYPISEIAPGCKVADDGKGIYICNERMEITIPQFTASLLETTILNPKTGYLTHPKVSSGPYVITNYDGVTVELEINKQYKGYNEDKKNIITNITYTLATKETMIGNLKNNKYDLLNKVTFKDAIDEGRKMIEDSKEEFTGAAYPRVGLTYLIFNPESRVAESLQVRKAVAYCLDQEQTVKEYTGNYGKAMEGFFGISSWPYKILTKTIDYPIRENTELTKETQMAIQGCCKVVLDLITEPPVNR